MDEQSTGLLHNRRLQGAATLTLLLLAVFLFAQSLNTFKAYRYIGSDVPAMNTIQVSGESEVFVRPDTAQFTFSIIETAPTTAAAQLAATNRVNAAMDFVREQGLDVDKDVRTLSYNLNPQYNNRCTGVGGARTCNQELVGFRVNETIEVKLPIDQEGAGTSTNALGAFVAGLATLGVQNVNGPTFEVADEDVHLAEARKAAIEDAQAKAEVLADDLGVTLVRLVNFSEMNEPMPYMVRNMAYDQAEGMGGAIAPEMPVGENEIRSQVMMVYEIR